MNTRYALSLALASIVTLTSCTDSGKKSADGASRSEKYGHVVHFEELMTRGGNALEVLDQTLQENDKVVLDFYAEWCGPCKKLSPILDTLAQEYTDVLFVKINVDTFGNISNKFDVKGIPALMFYKNGKRIEKTTGAKSKSDLKAMLKKLD